MMSRSIRFVDMDGASMPIDHPWGRARRDAIASQDAARKARNENRERKYQSAEDAADVSSIFSLKTTD